MSQVPAAAPAYDLHAMHPIAVVVAQLDFVLIHRLIEARPTGAGIELRVRMKQLLTAARTNIASILFVHPVLAGKCALGALLAQDMVLGWTQRLFPLRFRFYDFLFVHFFPSIGSPLLRRVPLSLFKAERPRCSMASGRGNLARSYKAFFRLHHPTPCCADASAPG